MRVHSDFVFSVTIRDQDPSSELEANPKVEKNDVSEYREAAMEEKKEKDEVARKKKEDRRMTDIQTIREEFSKNSSQRNASLKPVHPRVKALKRTERGKKKAKITSVPDPEQT